MKLSAEKTRLCKAVKCFNQVYMTNKLSILLIIFIFPQSLFAMCFDTLLVHNCAKDPGLTIFVGKVIGVEKADNIFDPQGNSLRVINVEVEKLYKGNPLNNKTISIYLENHSNAFMFSKDSTYLIYARPGGKEDIQMLRTSLCERTRLLSEAEYDLSILTKMFKPISIGNAKQKTDIPEEKKKSFLGLYIVLGTSLLLNILLFVLRK